MASSAKKKIYDFEKMKTLILGGGFYEILGLV